MNERCTNHRIVITSCFVWQRYMRRVTRPSFLRLGLRIGPEVDADRYADTYMRSTIIGMACSVDLKECTNAVKAQFYQTMRHGDHHGNRYRICVFIHPRPEVNGFVHFSSSDVNPNFRATIACTGVAEGGEEEWNEVWNKYKASNVATEQSYYLGALSCTKEVWLLNRYMSLDPPFHPTLFHSYSTFRLLEMSITPKSGIRKQDATRVIANVAYKLHGRDLAFDFVRQNWDRIKK